MRLIRKSRNLSLSENEAFNSQLFGNNKPHLRAVKIQKFLLKDLKRLRRQILSMMWSTKNRSTYQTNGEGGFSSIIHGSLVITRQKRQTNPQREPFLRPVFIVHLTLFYIFLLMFSWFEGWYPGSRTEFRRDLFLLYIGQLCILLLFIRMDPFLQRNAEKLISYLLEMNKSSEDDESE